MKSDQSLEKLLKLARQAPAEPAPTGAPYGFATRVVANWQAAEPVTLDALWQKLSLRSLVFAALLMAVSLGINYDLLSEDWSHELAMADTAIQEVLEP